MRKALFYEMLAIASMERGGKPAVIGDIVSLCRDLIDQYGKYEQ
jgi:hypothetical protein